MLERGGGEVIERWLQITCDGCGETDNSTFPNCTVQDLLTSSGFVVRGKRHLCRSCIKLIGSKELRP